MTRPPMAAETEPEIGGIVLAAGEGKRFGGPKQVARLDGRPLLEHAVRAMLAVPSISPVVVVLGAHADAVRAEVDLQRRRRRHLRPLGGRAVGLAAGRRGGARRGRGGRGHARRPALHHAPR